MNQLAPGIQLRDEGMALASGKADRVEPNWSETAQDYLKLFLHDCERGEFTSEEAQAVMLTSGLSKPASPNAWGSVFTTAAKRGLITKTGEYRQSQKASAHCRMVPVWRKA